MGTLLKRLVLVVLLLSAVMIAAALLFIDTPPVKHFVAARISDAIGRRLTISGDVALDWSLTPRLQLNRVALANTPWSDSPRMLEIGKLGVDIDLMALARGETVLPHLDVEDYRLLLERSSAGVPNWRFGEEEEREEPIKFPVIASLQMHRGTVVYRNRAAGVSRRVTLDRVRGGITGPTRRLEFTGSGRMAGKPLRLAANIAFATGDDAEAPGHPVSLDAALGEASAQLEGRARNPLSLDGLDAEVSLRGGAPVLLLPGGPAGRLKARLTHEGEVWQLRSLRAHWGESELTGRVELKLGGKRPAITATLTAPRLDLTPFFTTRPEAGGQNRNGGSIELPAAALRSFDADIRMTSERLKASGLRLHDLTMALSLRGGHLSITPLETMLAGGEVTSNLDVRADKTPTRTALELRVAELDLRKLLSALDIQMDGVGTVDAQLELSGTEDSLADWLAGAEGRLAIVMQKGRLDALLLELLTEDVTGVLEALVGLGQGANRIRCLIADAVVKDGVMEWQRFLIDTPETKIIGDGKVHLAQQTLDMKLLPRDKDFSLISGQAPIHIRGRVSDPEIGVDESAMAASLLAPIELGLNENADCQELARAARENL